MKKGQSSRLITRNAKIRYKQYAHSHQVSAYPSSPRSKSLISNPQYDRISCMSELRNEEWKPSEWWKRRCRSRCPRFWDQTFSLNCSLKGHLRFQKLFLAICPNGESHSLSQSAGFFDTPINSTDTANFIIVTSITFSLSRAELLYSNALIFLKCKDRQQSIDPE